MEESILRRIYVLGLEIESDLENGDLERVFERVQERGTLVEEVSDYEHASKLDPKWEDLGVALQKQYERLRAALSEQEGRIQDELAGMQRYKGASRSYQAPEARSQILNDNLRV